MRFFAVNLFSKRSFFKASSIPRLLLSALMVVTIVGGFTVPEKVFAAITPQEYEELKDYSKTIDFDYNVAPLTVGWASPSGKYLEFLGDAYNSKKNDPSATKRTVEVEALNSFIVYLNGQIANSTALPFHIDGLKRVLLLTNQKFQGAVSAVQLENGVITQTEHLDNVQNASQAASAAIAKRTTESKSCSIVPYFDISGCIDQMIAWVITHTLLAIAGWFLWVTATVMNYAINIGILNFSKWAEGLYPIWLVVRQITSLFVVFAGLWLGFMYIINKGDQFKKYIPWVVIFALFVNFSYPMVRTAIDISNIISLNIYASAVGADALSAGAVSITSEKTAGAIIRDKLGLSGLIDFATGSTKEGEGELNKINSTPAALLAVIFILYAAWIFFLVSALIVTRTAALVFIIVASPILLVDAVIPKLGEQAANLRKIFFEQLFVAPVFTVMLALTLKFLEVFQTSEALGKPVGVGSATGTPAIVMFFNLLMMLIMLHIMLKVTKATSGKIGEAVSGAVGKVGGFAVGGVALGGAGMIGRATVGRGAAAMRDSKWMSEWQDQGGVKGFAGKHLFNASNSLATSGFDARNSSFVRTSAEKVGMKLSTGNSMGFEAREAKDYKERSMRANFRNNSLKTKENRAREEYNAINENDIEGKKRFLSNLENSDDSKLKELRNKLEIEDRSKALKKYREFDDTPEGIAQKEKFRDKYKSTGDRYDQLALDNFAAYDAKLAEAKADKELQRKFQVAMINQAQGTSAASTFTATNKNLNTQTSPTSGGGNFAQANYYGQPNQPVAFNPNTGTASVARGVNPQPTVSPLYRTAPQTGQTSPVNPNIGAQQGSPTPPGSNNTNQIDPNKKDLPVQGATDATLRTLADSNNELARANDQLRYKMGDHSGSLDSASRRISTSLDDHASRLDTLNRNNSSGEDLSRLATERVTSNNSSRGNNGAQDIPYETNIAPNSPKTPKPTVSKIPINSPTEEGEGETSKKPFMADEF